MESTMGKKMIFDSIKTFEKFRRKSTQTPRIRKIVYKSLLLLLIQEIF